MADPVVEADQSGSADTVNDAAVLLRQDLEQNLRDLKLPDGVDWWPLAPGGWLLLIACAVILMAIAIQLLRRQHRQRTLDPALTRMEHIFAQWTKSAKADHYYQQVNVELRLAAFAGDDPESATRLTGHDWVDWMERSADYRFSDNARFALAESCYQREPVAPDATLHAEVCQWLRQFRLTVAKTRPDVSTAVTTAGARHA